MLIELESLLRNPLLQSLFLSPLIGAVFSLVLTSLTSGRREPGTTSVRETIIVIKERIVIRDRATAAGQTPSKDEAVGTLVLLVAGVVLAVYLYAVYAEHILLAAAAVSLGAIAFGLTALVVSAVRGRISGPDWVWHVLNPILPLFFALYLLYLAALGIVPGAREAAETVGAFQFYFGILETEHRNWILPQLLGLLCALMFLLLSILKVVHNVSALQVLYDGWFREVWLSIYLRTTRFSGRRAFIALLVLGTVSFLCLNGSVTRMFLSGSAA